MTKADLRRRWRGGFSGEVGGVEKERRRFLDEDYLEGRSGKVVERREKLPTKK